ncbi:MAG: Kelch repeat-containing protein [Candidatus Binataceae bacterium]
MAAGDVLFAGGLGSQQRDTELYKAATNTFAPPGTTAVMNNSRSAPTATRLSNGKVLIAGGFDPSSSSVLDSTELYDPTKNTFTPAAMMNDARDGATATTLSSGMVLLAGGAGFSTELYDPATNTFASAPPDMNDARDANTATRLGNGKVLLAGGCCQILIRFPELLSSTDLYDPATNSFAPSTQTASMNQARTQASAIELSNGKVLIVGGDFLIANPGSLASTELYDEASNTFAPAAETATMNDGRIAPAIVDLVSGPNAGKVLVIGGFGGPNLGEETLASTDLYDPATNSFAPSGTTPSMNIAREFVTATVLENGEVLVEGGPDASGNPVFAVELYDPVKNVFTLGPNTNNPQGQNTATLVQ